MIQVHDLIVSIEHRLEKIHDDPIARQQDAWWILQAVTNQSQAELLAHKTVSFTAQQYKQLEHWLGLHIDQQMPIQYILGKLPFGDLELFVERPVLIPRPETEEWTLALIEQLKPLTNKPLTILDLGCGTGCIAISLAKALPRATVYATDIADHALALTKKNIVHNKVQNITVLKSDLYTNLPEQLRFDLIVSNPPYIGTHEWPTLSPSVTQWEDQQALTAGTDGLDVIKVLIAQAPSWLKKNGDCAQHHIPQLVIEIGWQQGQAVNQLLKAAGFKHIEIKKDLEHKDRVACAGL